MIDVFVRVQPFYDDPIRYGLWKATKARWEADPDCRLIPLFAGPDIRGVRLEAEQRAESDPYIFTDDDVLVLGHHWVKKATGYLLAHPEYGIVSTLSMIEGENLAKPGYFGNPSEVDSEIYDMFAVGAPMVIRKGICSDLPEMDINSECGKIHEHVLAKGLKEGLLNPALALRHNHLGNGFSSNRSMAWGV